MPEESSLKLTQRDCKHDDLRAHRHRRRHEPQHQRRRTKTENRFITLSPDRACTYDGPRSDPVPGAPSLGRGTPHSSPIGIWVTYTRVFGMCVFCMCLYIKSITSRRVRRLLSILGFRASPSQALGQRVIVWRF